MKDIDEVRRDNLCIIEAEVGSASAAAALVGMSPAQFINLKKGAADSKTGKPRGMRKATARKIERLAAKPIGWLDIDHSADSFGPREWEKLTENQRNQVQQFIAFLLSAAQQDEDRPSLD